MKEKVFLVVCESNKSSISYATFDQFKSHRMCHLLGKLSKIPQAVVTEKWFDLPLSVRLQIRKQFPKEFVTK